MILLQKADGSEIPLNSSQIFKNLIERNIRKIIVNDQERTDPNKMQNKMRNS